MENSGQEQITIKILSIQGSHSGFKKILPFILLAFFINKSYSFDFAVSWWELKNKYVVKQKFDFSCGAASVATILTYFFYDITTEEEVIKFILGKRRLYYKKIKELEKEDFYLSMKDLVDYLKHNGYSAIPVAIDLKQLKYLKYPCIVYLKFRGQEHFSVLKKINNDYVYLADPSLGNVVIPVNRFRNYFFTRKDKKFPGKVILIYKDSPINKEFMEVQKIYIQKQILKLPVVDFIINR